MKIQNQIILSIGTNQGEKLANIEQAVNLIHSEIATVVKVSKLYESPSWGFESDVFYNCAVLVHSCKTSEEILEEILQAEKKLGRIRNEAEG